MSSSNPRRDESPMQEDEPLHPRDRAERTKESGKSTKEKSKKRRRDASPPSSSAGAAGSRSAIPAPSRGTVASPRSSGSAPGSSRTPLRRSIDFTTGRLSPTGSGMGTAGPSTSQTPRSGQSSSQIMPAHSQATLAPSPSQQTGQQDEDQQPPSKRAKTTSTPTSVPHPPQSASSWHLHGSQIPKEAERTKTAIQYHIRVMWGLYSQNSLPPSTDKDVVVSFNARLAGADGVTTTVQAAIANNAAAINDARKRCHDALASLQPLKLAGGGIAQALWDVGEDCLVFIFQKIAATGLQKWSPDISQSDPESLYNQLHEQLALKTWRQVALTAGGYNHLQISLHYAKQDAFFIRVYRSFVFSYIQKKVDREARSPGSAALDIKMDNVYRRRQDLRRNRLTAIISHGIQRASGFARNNEANPAHSDDELDPAPPTNGGGPQYLIHEKVGRADKVTKFFRLLDVARREEILRKKGARGLRNERKRVDPPAGKAEPSQIPTLPMDVPIDWYKPDVWNSWSLRERANFISAQPNNIPTVALPPANVCATFKSISDYAKACRDPRFMEKYGNEVLADYHIPTDEEIKQVEEMEDEFFDEDLDADGDL
ncbi:hypothetical protein K523DRAFT_364623 [Schizophyllum commune Tattone D]|nr:hypothetical protein K523DRAFT_364623 [Schizophyllum commune Tattone D]